jgi:hypothetical protein
MTGVADKLPLFSELLSLPLGTQSKTGVGLPPIPSS